MAGFVSPKPGKYTQGLKARVANLRFSSGGREKSCVRSYCTALQSLLAAAARAVAILFQLKKRIWEGAEVLVWDP